jgi:hypothetical protein
LARSALPAVAWALVAALAGCGDPDASPSPSPPPPLVSAPRALPKRGHGRVDVACFVTWFDSSPRLVYGWTAKDVSFGRSRELRVARGDEQTFDLFPVATRVYGLRGVAQGPDGPLLVGLCDDDDVSVHADRVVVLDATGKRLWDREQPAGRGGTTKDVAFLADDRGPYGIAVAEGGESGIVALDFSGKVAWRRPREYVMYQLGTHPRLPGRLLSIGAGRSTLFEHTRAGVLEPWDSPGDEGLYVSHGVVFPDAEGRPSIVIAGKRHGRDHSLLLRLDAADDAVWTVALTGECAGLAMLEPEGAPRLFAVTTRKGELLLLDDAGATRWRGLLPGSTGDEDVWTYALEVGRIAPGRWAVAIRLLRDAWLYEVNVDALGAPAPK